MMLAGFVGLTAMLGSPSAKWGSDVSCASKGRGGDVVFAGTGPTTATSMPTAARTTIRGRQRCLMPVPFVPNLPVPSVRAGIRAELLERDTKIALGCVGGLGMRQTHTR